MPIIFSPFNEKLELENLKCFADVPATLVHEVQLPSPSRPGISNEKNRVINVKVLLIYCHFLCSPLCLLVFCVTFHSNLKSFTGHHHGDGQRHMLMNMHTRSS